MWPTLAADFTSRSKRSQASGENSMSGFLGEGLGMGESIEDVSAEVAEIHEIPPMLLVAIGALLMEFSHLEITLNHLIWTILRLSTDDGKDLTVRLDTRPKLEILKEVSRRYIGSDRKVKTIKDASKRISELTMYRNACAHGMWYVKNGHLTCSSYRWDAEDGFVSTKHISLQQLADVTSEIVQIDHDLMRIELGLPHSLQGSRKRRRVMRPIPVRRPEPENAPKRKPPQKPSQG